MIENTMVQREGVSFFSKGDSCGKMTRQLTVKSTTLKYSIREVLVLILKYSVKHFMGGIDLPSLLHEFIRPQ